MRLDRVRRIDALRRQSLANAFLLFLPIEDRRRNPTYWAICRGVARRPFLLSLADVVPPPQFAPNVLLASVHDRLLEGADHELAVHYRSVAARRGLPYRTADDVVLLELFEDFCRREREAIVERCRTKTTQTNEVARCSVFRAALASLGTERPVCLLDLGCSAGLNLFVDAYGVDYAGTRVGPSEKAPLLRCDLREGDLPPLELPAVAARHGVDHNPVDLADPVQARWLLACLWPDDLERFDRLDAAMQLVGARRDELQVTRGDMVDDLESAVAGCDPDARVVVLTSWAAAYLSASRRHELAAAMQRAAAGRDLAWVAMEFSEVARDLGVLPADAPRRHRGATVVCVTRYRAGAPSFAMVAECHPHGRWLDWHGGP